MVSKGAMLGIVLGIAVVPVIASARAVPPPPPPSEFPIDPNDPDIEQKLIGAAYAILIQKFPQLVPDLTCGEWPYYDSTVAVGVETTSGRYTGIVECIIITEWDSEGRPITGALKYFIDFYLDTGELTNYSPLVYVNPERNHYWKCDGPDNCYEGPM